MDILKSRDGVVIKTDYKRVIKEATDEANIKGIQNAARFYLALQGTPYIPKLYNFTDTMIEREYIKEDYINDSLFHEEFRRNCIRVIFDLQRRGIRHGDLVGPNFIVRGTWPVIIDWDQSNFVYEKIPQTTPVQDSNLLYSSIYHYTGDTYRIVRRWECIRRHLDFYQGWGNIVDLGTRQGDMVALARSQNFYATGVDNLKMRSTCITEARNWWGQYGCRFIETDMIDFDCSEYDIALLLSAWPYLIQQHGRDRAVQMLERVINQVDTLFFETQLYGDGPGPDFLQSDDDVYSMLSKISQDIMKLDTIPGTQTRTLWKISKNKNFRNRKRTYYIL